MLQVNRMLEVQNRKLHDFSEKIKKNKLNSKIFEETNDEKLKVVKRELDGKLEMIDTHFSKS